MPSPDSGPIPVILLAAGESRRMGAQKQLLTVRGQPMVRQAAELAGRLSPGPVIVVVGANGEKVAAALAGLNVHCTANPQWREGMGASLRHGMRELARIAPEAPAVLVLLADQPGLPAGHLAALLEHHRQFPDDIVTSEYRGVSQPPAVFPRAWFGRLAELAGDRGAKALLHEAGDRVRRVPVESLGDIDTPEDYDAFVKNTPG